MLRLTQLAANVGRYRILVQLGLLVVGLLAMSLGGGAPDCEYSGSGGC